MFSPNRWLEPWGSKRVPKTSLNTPIGYMSTYAACAIAISDRYDDMSSIYASEHTSKNSRTDLETAIDVVVAAIMLHKQPSQL